MYHNIDFTCVYNVGVSLSLSVLMHTRCSCIYRYFGTHAFELFCLHSINNVQRNLIFVLLSSPSVLLLLFFSQECGRVFFLFKYTASLYTRDREGRYSIAMKCVCWLSVNSNIEHNLAEYQRWMDPHVHINIFLSEHFALQFIPLLLLSCFWLKFRANPNGKFRGSMKIWLQFCLFGMKSISNTKKKPNNID